MSREFHVTQKIAKDCGLDAWDIKRIENTMFHHKDFRAQLRAWAAEEMRGLVAGRQAADRSCEDEDRWLINGHNACRAETLANITAWEKANEG